jgi:hypothetical protein
MTQETLVRAPLAGDEASYHAFVNGALETLATLHSGATAPGETYPGMLWLDTGGAAPILRQRAAANNGWVALALDYATQAQAVAGTDATRPMTALRVAQAIAAQVASTSPDAAFLAQVASAAGTRLALRRELSFIVGSSSTGTRQASFVWLGASSSVLSFTLRAQSPSTARLSQGGAVVASTTGTLAGTISLATGGTFSVACSRIAPNESDVTAAATFEFSDAAGTAALALREIVA